MSKGKLTAEEFERILETQTETSRITLSDKRFSDENDDNDDDIDMNLGYNYRKKTQLDDLDDILDEKPRTSETQSLADFLKSTGPESDLQYASRDPPPKKKKGLFSFGKKKRDVSKSNAGPFHGGKASAPSPTSNPGGGTGPVNSMNSMVLPTNPQQQKAKYVPLTAVAAGGLSPSYGANTGSSGHRYTLSDSSAPPLTREQQQMLAREQTERELQLHQQMLTREQQNGFVPPTNASPPLMYSLPANSYASNSQQQNPVYTTSGSTSSTAAPTTASAANPTYGAANAPGYGSTPSSSGPLVTPISASNGYSNNPPQSQGSYASSPASYYPPLSAMKPNQNKPVPKPPAQQQGYYSPQAFPSQTSKYPPTPPSPEPDTETGDDYAELYENNPADYFNNPDNRFSDDEEEDGLEDQGYDGLVMANTEYNAMMDHSDIKEVKKSKSKNTKKTVVFNQVVEEIGHPDDFLPEEPDDDLPHQPIIGLGARGSYYPTFAAKTESNPPLQQQQTPTHSMPNIQQQQQQQQQVNQTTAMKPFFSQRFSSLPAAPPVTRESSKESTSKSFKEIRSPVKLKASPLTKSDDTPSSTDTKKSRGELEQTPANPLLQAVALPGSEKPVKRVRTKKKIRHVQIQTRAAITREGTTQTTLVPSDDFSETGDYQQLRTRNAALENSNKQLQAQMEEVSRTLALVMKEKNHVVMEMEEKASKFDKLSAQAYKKIKELLNERKMLEIEVSSLKEQMDALHDFQSRNWSDELEEWE